MSSAPEVRPPVRRHGVPGRFTRWRRLLTSAHPGVQLATISVPIVCLLTAAAVIVAWRGYQRAISTTNYEAQLLATSAAVDAQRFLANRIELLESISAAGVMSRGDLPEIHQYLNTMVTLTGFSEIGYLDTRGYALVVGGAPFRTEPLFAGDRPHVRRALWMGQPVVGNAQISRVSQQPTVNVVVPMKRGGQIVGLLAGALRLNGPKITDLRFGNVPGLRVLDGAGNLAVIGEEEGLRELENKSLWPEYTKVRSAPQGWLLAPVGLTGKPDRLVGFSAVAGSDWVVVVDRSRAEEHADAERTLQAELSIVLGFAASALVGVLWASYRLEGAARRFVRFTETLTHDVGTPLTVIRAYATRLQRALGDRPALQADVREIDHAGRRIERMVQALTDLLGPPGRPHLTRDELDLGALVREIVEEYEHRTGRMMNCIDPAAPIIGDWDRLRLERVVDNLVSNALKFSPADSEVTVRVMVEEAAPARHAVIQVQDAGRGIPIGEEEAVWERFRRGSNVGSVPGQGVGLASVRQIVEEHGGTVWLRSTPGRGTVVTVRLPWPEDDAQDPPEAPEHPEERSHPA